MDRPSEPAAIAILGRVRSLRDEANDLRGMLATADAGSSSPRSATAWTPGVLPADFLDGYAFVREVHRGGQGVVYEATQLATRRRVAIKLIRPALPADESRQRRFAREAELITQLRHPNVVTVLDAGEREGISYLVMEYVDGRPIDAFVADGRPDLKTLLRLFVDICDAVNAAHLKGVIHRDIKPGNILIDETGCPRVLDFGLAKLIPDPSGDAETGIPSGSSLAPDTLTHEGQFLGSLPWASPEQAIGRQQDIDIRTDVYSLGVVLYQLLTGRFPYDVAGPMRDVLNRIVTAEPLRPRAVLRASVPPSLRPRFPVIDELETIVLKCLAKDPARRYQSAGDLAADLRRFLVGEPIAAKRNSGWYALRKMVRRHRLPAAIAATFVVVVTIGFATTLWAWQRSEQQREVAEKREKQTQDVSGFQGAMLSGIDVEAMGRGIKESFCEQVRAALERQYVGEFPDRRKRRPEEVETLFAAFNQGADAAQAADVARGVMDEFVLARAADALEKRFADQPLVQAKIHFALGRTYGELGMSEAAELHLRAALEILRGQFGPESAHAEVAECLYNLAGLRDDKRNFREAEALYRDALAMWRELHGEDNQMVARTLDALAGAVMGQDRLDEAESLLNEALRLNRENCDEDDPEVISNLADLATLLWKKRQFPEAEARHREVLEKRRRLLGDRDPAVAQSMLNLAQAITSQGRHAEAEKLFRETLAMYRALYGDEHWLVAKSMSHIGVQLESQGRRAEAETMYRGALAQQRRSLGDDHLDVRNTLMSLARLRQQEGDHDEAVMLLRESLTIAERMYPDGHPEAWRRFSAMGGLGIALARQAKALLPADRESALALFHGAEPLFTTDYIGMLLSPSGGGLEERRRAAEQTVMIFEFWHSVAPDRGWGERAAQWRAKLQEEAQGKKREAPGAASEEPSP